MWVAAVYVSLTYFGTRPSDRAQIWLACADIYSHLKKKIDSPHPGGGGFRGLYIVKNLSRRTAPKFGTHVRIDTLTLKKIKCLTHPTPGGFRGLYIVKNLSRRTAPKFGTHVRIDTLTLKNIKKLTHPTPGGFRGLNCLARLALARERTPSSFSKLLDFKVWKNYTVRDFCSKTDPTMCHENHFHLKTIWSRKLKCWICSCG